MLVHEIAGIASLIVIGAIVISALNKNSATSSVLSSSFQGFSQVVQTMEGQTAANQGG